MKLFLSLLSVIGLQLPLLVEGIDKFKVPKEVNEQIKDGKPLKADKVHAYIVTMDDMPVVAYEGGKSNLPATKPDKGEKLNKEKRKVVKYRNFLEKKHDSALGEVSAQTNKVHDYSVTFDGFAAQLTQKQAGELRTVPGVISVTKDEIIPMDTISTPDFLGLTGRGGVWDHGYRGEGVIIGILDSGIWPENPSFADHSGCNQEGNNQESNKKEGNKKEGNKEGNKNEGNKNEGNKNEGNKNEGNKNEGNKNEGNKREGKKEGTNPNEGNKENNNPNEGIKGGNKEGTKEVNNKKGNKKGENEDACGTLPGWHGKCMDGEDFNYTHCNQKLIGARWYGEGFGGAEGIKDSFPYEFVSPRAASGHGVHTASTAGGNDNVEVEIDGVYLGTASGMAPLARISSYKVCWGVGEGGCALSDMVAAIEQAVLDGVDVINFSISGTRTEFFYPVEVAFMRAADAGVFIAASAGNSGPHLATVAHPSPWITTVAAGTNGRLFEADVALGSSSTFTGASIQTIGTGILDLVYSANVGLTGASPEEVRLCYPETLDPLLVSGKMVLCDRGEIARVDKSRAVQIAGGAAMILANPEENSINADFHYVPSIHVQNDVGGAIREYATTAPNPTASLSPSSQTPVEAEIATFSSRGPLLATPDLLKPDIMAPGQNILAAVSPVGGNGRDFDFYSGTSMSSPHIAGLAAVIKSAHPDWSPMMIKSAMMTSATDTPASPFDEGSGQVMPMSAIDPGLVYDSNAGDWVGFLCGTGQLSSWACNGLKIDPSDLNTPNIAIGRLVGKQTVTRQVTNVGKKGTYDVVVVSPPGVDVQVEPSQLILETGESASYKVTFFIKDSEASEYSFGELTWVDKKHNYNVRSVLAVFPAKFYAPDEVSADGSSGTINVDVAFGYEDGVYEAASHGLVKPELISAVVLDDPGNNFGSAEVGVNVHMITIPIGMAYTRFSMFDSYTDGDDDLDLYIFDSDGNFVDGSGSGTSNEQVNLESPAPGLYYAVVHGWQTDGPDAAYTLFYWNVPGTPGGNLPLDITSSPTSAPYGGTGTVDVFFDVSSDSTTKARKYLGAISHSNAGGLIDLTIVNVNDD